MKATILMGAALLAAQSLYAGASTGGFKASTLGAGAEIGTSLGDSFGIRLTGNYFSADYDDTVDSIDYNLDLNLLSFGAMLDWYPFSNAFRITAGALFNSNEIEAQADSSASYEIGETTYPAASVGTLQGEVDFNAIAPYAGIGIDTSFDKNYGLGIVLELGVVYQGSPDVSLTADGPLAGDPAFQAELAREEKSIQNDLDEYKLYPVLTAGLIFRF